MAGHIEDFMQGLEFEGPADVRAWVEEQRYLTDREKRRALAFADQWEASVTQTVLERVNSAVEEAAESWARVKARLDEARRQIGEVQTAVARDRLHPQEAMKKLGELRREIREANALLDVIERAGERAEETANTRPDDYLADLRRRFPSVPLATERLSAKYLRGEESSPFVERRS